MSVFEDGGKFVKEKWLSSKDFRRGWVTAAERFKKELRIHLDEIEEFHDNCVEQESFVGPRAQIELLFDLLADLEVIGKGPVREKGQTVDPMWKALTEAKVTHGSELRAHACLGVPGRVEPLLLVLLESLPCPWCGEQGKGP